MATHRIACMISAGVAAFVTVIMIHARPHIAVTLGAIALALLALVCILAWQATKED